MSINLYSGMITSGTVIQGSGDAVVTGKRLKQTKANVEDLYGWELLMYGSYGNIAKNVNSQLGDNYINNDQFVVTTNEKKKEGLYKLDNKDSFADWDLDKGTITIKKSKDVVDELGLTSTEGESAVNYLKLGKNTLKAVTIQNQAGSDGGKTSADLNQASFGSKWNGTWQIYNVDLDKGRQSISQNYGVRDNLGLYTDYNTEGSTTQLYNTYIASMLLAEANDEYEQILTDDEKAYVEAGETAADRYERFKTVMKNHSFKPALV